MKEKIGEMGVGEGKRIGEKKGGGGERWEGRKECVPSCVTPVKTGVHKTYAHQCC